MWIQSHEEISRHPKTRRAARHLEIKVPQMVGHLHMFWHYCLAFAQNGDITRVDPFDIADAVMWDGDPQTFMDALLQVGFVDALGKELHVHDWHDYGGKLIERRERDAERKRKSRPFPADATGPEGESAHGTPAPSDGVPAEFRAQSTQEESTQNQSTEDQSTNSTHAAAPRASATVASTAAPPACVPESFNSLAAKERIEAIYQAYPRREAKGSALKAISAALKKVRQGATQPDAWNGAPWPPSDAAAFLLQRVQLYARAAEGVETRYIPYPATWFNEGRYLNEIQPNPVTAAHSSHATDPPPAPRLSPRAASNEAAAQRFLARKGIQLPAE